MKNPNDDLKNNARGKNPGSISRRTFLKSTGVLTGSLALTSIVVSTGCDSEKPTTKQPTSTPPPSTSPTTSKPTTKPPTTTTNNGEFVYVPPTTNPPLEDTVGCTSKVATDRLYSYEHVWVKPLQDDLAVIGLTDKMHLLLGAVERGEMTLRKKGDVLAYDGWLGNFEGQKLNVDMYSPVSGTIVQVNEDLYINSLIMQVEPYLRGWIYVIELSKPEELDNLISGIDYAIYNTNPNV
ncbi:MAG: twin-arginine translocation signal domain-containing protein [Dehalococcoidales bacterium]|nr:twin-arginine translocation signal domain-containing protein [Dehalococcoidales bacterium]MDD5604907.1 twin-arginine translocation signal domain-containing protein [Dehalococcoidales bacterium]NLE89674.1 twin-arginine translocation signal domain-containing protein [Dehalococcoidales bacterium]